MVSFWRFREAEPQITMFTGRYFLASWRYLVPDGDWLGVVYRDPGAPWVAMFGVRDVATGKRTWIALEAPPGLPEEEVEREFDRYVNCLAVEQGGRDITRGSLRSTQVVEAFKRLAAFLKGS